MSWRHPPVGGLEVSSGALEEQGAPPSEADCEGYEEGVDVDPVQPGECPEEQDDLRLQLGDQPAQVMEASEPWQASIPDIDYCELSINAMDKAEIRFGGRPFLAMAALMQNQLEEYRKDKEKPPEVTGSTKKKKDKDRDNPGRVTFGSSCCSGTRRCPEAARGKAATAVSKASEGRPLAPPPRTKFLEETRNYLDKVYVYVDCLFDKGGVDHVSSADGLADQAVAMIQTAAAGKDKDAQWLAQALSWAREGAGEDEAPAVLVLRALRRVCDHGLADSGTT